MTLFIERFFLHAQAYFPLTSSDQSFAADQNLVLMIVTKAGLGVEKFSNVVT